MSAEKIDLLRSIRFGKRVAEDEVDELEKYFVQTTQWNRVHSGEVDVIYGSKGSGKSAIYALISRKENEFFDKKILIKTAENVRGTSVFSDLTINPPPNERDFIKLWKLYILLICGNAIREFDLGDKSSRKLVSSLEQAELLPKKAAISLFFKNALTFIMNYCFPEKESA